MRILISGFEAFGGNSTNPTEALVRELQQGRVKLPAGVIANGLVLPVTFKDASVKLDQEIAKFDPEIVIAFGLAGGRDAIEFERVAINCMDSEIPDNSGVHVRDLPIELHGQAAYFATLPIRELSEAVKASGIPSRISNTAGLYVCNYVMYRLLESHPNRKCGFVHVPFLGEQKHGQMREQAGEKPSLPLESLTKALSVIIETLAKTT